MQILSVCVCVLGQRSGVLARASLIFRSSCEPERIIIFAYMLMRGNSFQSSVVASASAYPVSGGASCKRIKSTFVCVCFPDALQALNYQILCKILYVLCDFDCVSYV